MREDINLTDGLNAAGFKQQDIPGLPEGVTAFVPDSTLPKEGEIVKGGPWDGFEVISVYSRAQAIDDGVLIDLSRAARNENGLPLVREAGFLLPAAMTATAFAETVNAGTTETDDGEFIYPPGQSMIGRLWDVLFVLRTAIRSLSERGQETDRVHFKVAVDVNGDGKRNTVALWAMIGPGDTAAPVLTIMLEGED